MNTIKDVLYEFLQEPTRENFTELVLNSTGEQDNIDFKQEWIKDEKMAEIILAIANSGGGSVVIGIKENDDGTTEAIGVEKLVDKADIESKISKYLPSTLSFDVQDFDYSGEEYSKLKDKKFQVLFVNSEEEKLPYVWSKDSGKSTIGCVFIRRGTKTCKANNEELQNLIDTRIRATYSNGSSLELDEHLKQLKTLYESIKRNNTYPALGQNWSKLFDTLWQGGIKRVENLYYPKEGYDEFVGRMIEKKKLKIEKILDLK